MCHPIHTPPLNSHILMWKESGIRADASFPLPLSSEGSHLVAQDGESVAVLLVFSVCLRMSHIKVTFDMRDLLSEMSILFRKLVCVFVCVCVCVCVCVWMGACVCTGVSVT